MKPLMTDMITKKKDGKPLTEEEIRFWIDGVTKGDIPDYQTTALLMALCLRGMSEEETLALTLAMRDSGDRQDLSDIAGIKVDKHSTGGVGDKVSLIAAPLAASCGVPVAKMSGRGLGFTGGTVDKLASIPGFQTVLSAEAFRQQVREIGLAIISQSGEIAPADKKLYALRDVTGTVESLGLIASSIMSKKLASGADAVVLDVKCGGGAFMQTEEDARALAHAMIRIGRGAGKRMGALLTDMSRPLGNAVGNAIEVREAVEVLQGNGPADIREISLAVAGFMIYLGDKAPTLAAGRARAEDSLASGEGLKKLEEMIRAQGGDASVTRDPSLLLAAPLEKEVRAAADGFVTAMDARGIGNAAQRAGAGRRTRDDVIDAGAGILLHKKVGDAIRAGESLLTVFASDKERLQDAFSVAQSACTVAPERRIPPPLIHAFLTDEK